MQYVYIIVLGLHVLAGVFWAGTTIAVARDPEIRIERFFRPQMRAAGMVFLTGALLWYFFHGGYFGSMEMVLALGIATALLPRASRARWSALPAGSSPALTRPRKPSCARK